MNENPKAAAATATTTAERFDKNHISTSIYYEFINKFKFMYKAVKNVCARSRLQHPVE